MAVTDHDTTGGWDEAVDAVPVGLSLVRGCEVSCSRRGISLHLLAYLFDPAEPAFAAARLQLRESRVRRAQRMVELLVNDGHDVSWDQVRELAGGTVGRPHVAQALMAAGEVSTVGEAFTQKWIGTRGRYWVDKHELDVVEAVALVTGAGGVAVFAHPAASKRGRTVEDDVIADMAAAGLGGLEVDHPDHDESEKAHLRALAAELGLFSTGSSDFHGSNKTVQLGAFTTSPTAYDELVQRSSGIPVVAG